MFLAPGNIPKFAPIAERHPGLPLIIDHMSLTAEIAQERKVKEAIDAVVALAKYPNVSVKLSSAPTYSLDPKYPWPDMTDAHQALLRCLRSAPLLLGHRPHQRLRQVDLPPAHHPFHRRADVPVRARTWTG